MNELFENPFMKKKDNFLKSPAEAPAHRKVLLEDRHFPIDTKAFERLYKHYDEIISNKNAFQ